MTSRKIKNYWVVIIVTNTQNNFFRRLIIGGMTQMHDNDIPFGQSSEEIILSICNDYNYPIVFNFPAGHIKDNRALILGRKAELIISKTETILTFDS